MFKFVCLWFIIEVVNSESPLTKRAMNIRCSGDCRIAHSFSVNWYKQYTINIPIGNYFRNHPQLGTFVQIPEHSSNFFLCGTLAFKAYKPNILIYKKRREELFECYPQNNFVTLKMLQRELDRFEIDCLTANKWDINRI